MFSEVFCLEFIFFYFVLYIDTLQCVFLRVKEMHLALLTNVVNFVRALYPCGNSLTILADWSPRNLCCVHR